MYLAIRTGKFGSKSETSTYSQRAESTGVEPAQWFAWLQNVSSRSNEISAIGHQNRILW